MRAVSRERAVLTHENRVRPMTATQGTTPSTTPGTVYLVGAGPGDSGLLTLRAAECLAVADMVLYDNLVDPIALEHVATSAELLCLAQHGGGKTLSLDEINTLMLDEARKGKTVVRMKSGDPSVLGRCEEETKALRDARIPFEIIPGITAAVALGPTYCEIPVALVVGQERRAKAESQIDYGTLAEFPGTLVFFMGVSSVEVWSRALIEHGKPPDTPVAIVRWCTRPGQETIRCALSAVVQVVAQRSIRPPALFVVGKAMDRAPLLCWFSSRPLFGKRVLVTGSPATSKKLRERLNALGARVIRQPAIEITDPADWAPVDAALDDLDRYDWLVFSSSNGIDYFFHRLLERGGDIRRLSGVKLAVIGSETAARLAAYHLQADLVPEQFNAEALAEALAGDAKGKRFLLATAGRGRQVLADELRKAGAQLVDRIAVYDSVDVEAPDADVVAALSAGDVDWVTVSSSATARSLVRLYGDSLRQARLASISPLTSTVLRDLGHEPAAEASPSTMAGVVEAIVAARGADA